MMAGDVFSTLNSNTFEDLSGIQSSSANPYDALIDACGGDSVRCFSFHNNSSLTTLKIQIQRRYQVHREARNEQQKAKLLDPNFPGWIIDPILEKLIHHEEYPQYADPRNCFVFWARPPEHLRSLISAIQTQLLKCKPGKPSLTYR